jgi:hypothetical protein
MTLLRLNQNEWLDKKVWREINDILVKELSGNRAV